MVPALLPRAGRHDGLVTSREIHPISELEPWKSDPPPFRGPLDEEMVRLDEAALLEWPYDVPDFGMPDVTARYSLKLWPIEGVGFLEPYFFTVWLCPPGISPETHGVLAMGRRGVATVGYTRHVDGTRLGKTVAPRIKKGWPQDREYAFGGKMGKTNWTFVAHATAFDGYDVSVVVLDDPRRRTRDQVLHNLNLALTPLRPKG